MAERDAFIEKLEAQVREWSARLEELRRRAGKVAAERRSEYKEQIEALQERREAIQQRVNELRHAGEHAWEELRDGADRAWEDMRKALEVAASRFRSGGTARRADVTVRELMTPDPRICRAEDRLADVARILWERDCGCVPVVDELTRVVGMVTDRDVCMAAYFQNRPLSELHVSDAMSRDVAACHPDDAVEIACAILRERQVRRLPVCDDSGRIVGLLSLNDLSRAAERDRQKRSGKRVKMDDVAHTLAAVGEPHPQSASAAG